MAGPGGREVGRLNIRVLPNTDRFSTSLQRLIDRVERRAQLKVNVTPDMRGFTQDMQGHLAQIRARVSVPVTPDTSRFAERVRADLAATSSRLKVPVEPDTSGFNARLQDQVATATARVQVPVDPDTSRFAERVRAQLANTSARAVRVQVTPDLRGFRRQLRRDLVGIDPEIPARLVVHAGEIARLRAALLRVQPPVVVPVRVDVDRGAMTSLRNGVQSLASSGAGLGRTLASVAGLAVALAASVPAVSSLVVSLAQIAPAAAVGATAMLAIVSAGAAIKIGTAGVGEALKNAFDPANAEAFAAALKKLTPNAREFVLAMKGLAPEFKGVRKAVQERLFDGLGKQVTAAGKVALPILRRSLTDTAGALNGMGKGVLTAAKDLSTSGALGKALGGANKGLTNLKKIPGEFVKGLTEIAAAASPAFDRLTGEVGKASTRISARITAGLKSGRIEEVIDRAIAKAKELKTVFGNVGQILKNIFGPAAAAGGDFLGVLKTVTGELAKVTASRGVQDALKEVFGALGDIAKSASGLLSEALRAAAPAIQELAGPAKNLARDLSGGLRSILRELGPILKDFSENFGRLSEAVGPLIREFLDLGGMLMGSLRPVLDKVGEQVALIAESAKKLLGPALKELKPLIEPVTDLFGKLATIFLDIQNKVLEELQPAFDKLGIAFGEVVKELQPLVDSLTEFVGGALTELKPILDPIIQGVGELASLLASGLAETLRKIVIPAIQGLTALLKGDFSTAWQKAKDVVNNGVALMNKAMTRLPVLLNEIMNRVKAGLRQKALEAMLGLNARFAAGVESAKRQIALLPGKASSALSGLGSRVGARANSELVQLRSAVSRKIAEAVQEIRRLPSRAAGALAGTGGALRSAGAQLINGMIQGVTSQAGALAASARRAVSGAISAAKNALGIRSPSKVFAEIGRNTIAGLIKGIDGTTAKLRQRLESLGKQIPSTTKSALARSLRKSTTQLGKLVTQRDKVVKNLAAAEKRLKDVTKARSDINAKIRDGILSGADITRESGTGATAGGIAERLKKDLAAAKKFASDIASLRKRGLRADLLAQIGQAGVEGGAAAANALAKASDAELKEINSLQKRLAAEAGKTGNTVADAMYKSGVQAAQGVVAGLKKSKKSIEQVMIDIARGMQKAIRKALGIKSPARTMIPVGVNSVLGVVRGLDRERPTLEAAMRSLVPIPSLAGVTAGALSVAPAGDAVPLELNGPLTLSSGEFLGYLSGVMSQRDQATVAAFRARRKG